MVLKSVAEEGDPEKCTASIWSRTRSPDGEGAGSETTSPVPPVEEGRSAGKEASGSSSPRMAPIAVAARMMTRGVGWKFCRTSAAIRARPNMIGTASGPIQTPAINPAPVATPQALAIDSDERKQLLEGGSGDAFDLDQLLGIGEGAMLGPVGDDALGQHGTNAGQSFQLGCSGGVQVEQSWIRGRSCSRRLAGSLALPSASMGSWEASSVPRLGITICSPSPTRPAMLSEDTSASGNSPPAASTTC